MRRALACVGVLLAVAMAPGALLAQTMDERILGATDTTPPFNPGPSVPPASGDPGQCLEPRALSGVVAPNDRDVILRFGRADFYRLKLTRACPALVEPGAQVVSIQRDSAAVCLARDMELKVVVGDGLVSRCGVRSLDRMSKADLAAAAATQQR